jgi:hypothetical protein
MPRNTHNRHPISLSEKVAIGASIGAGIAGAILVASQLLPSCETVDAKGYDTAKSSAVPATSTYPSETASPSESPTASASASEATATAANTDPWADLRRQLAAPFAGCKVRSYTNGGPASGRAGAYVYRFNDTEYALNGPNTSARRGRSQTGGNVTWSDATLTAAVITPDAGLGDRPYETRIVRTAPNGGPSEVDIFLSSNASSPKPYTGYPVVVGVETSATSRDSYGRSITTTAFVPCEGDSQLALQGGSWRPVGEQVDLPPIIMADAVS